jgi:hypothetical protein
MVGFCAVELARWTKSSIELKNHFSCTIKKTRLDDHGEIKSFCRCFHCLFIVICIRKHSHCFACVFALLFCVFYCLFVVFLKLYRVGLSWNKIVHDTDHSGKAPLLVVVSFDTPSFGRSKNIVIANSCKRHTANSQSQHLKTAYNSAVRLTTTTDDNRAIGRRRERRQQPKPTTSYQQQQQQLCTNNNNNSAIPRQQVPYEQQQLRHRYNNNTMTRATTMMAPTNNNIDL